MNAPEAIADVVMFKPSSSLDSHSLRGLCAPSGACGRCAHHKPREIRTWRDPRSAISNPTDRVRAGTAMQSGHGCTAARLPLGCGFWQKFCWLRPSSLSRAKTRARPAPVDQEGPSASDPSTQTSRPVRSDPPIAARDRSKTRGEPFHRSGSRVKFQLRLGELIIHSSDLSDAPIGRAPDPTGTLRFRSPPRDASDVSSATDD